MQPYFAPYIGYFQLMATVDKFIVYDNIQFSKKGWIHRNRILVNGQDSFISLPLKKDSDYLNVSQRFLSDSYTEEKVKLKRKIEGAYAKAPFYKDVFPLVAEIIDFDNDNLFDYVFNSIKKIKTYLDIDTILEKSSGLAFNIEEYKGQEKVLAICKNQEASVYINPIGGVELYDKEIFAREGVELKFLRSKEFVYEQFKNSFVPWLSIIDVMMFNNREKIKEVLQTGFTYE